MTIPVASIELIRWSVIVWIILLCLGTLVRLNRIGTHRLEETSAWSFAIGTILAIYWLWIIFSLCQLAGVTLV